MVRRHDPDVVDADSVEDILRVLVDDGWEAAQSALPVVADTPVPVVPATPGDPPPEDDELRDESASAPVLSDLGLLTDLATGRKDATEVARAAGLSVPELQEQVAYTLAEIEPEEIQRVIGLQAIQQQIKSGALYGSVLASLARDLVEGRLTPAHKLEMAKVLAKIGRVEPREEKGVAVGGGFTLNINVGGGAPPVVIEAQPLAEGA